MVADLDHIDNSDNLTGKERQLKYYILYIFFFLIGIGLTYVILLSLYGGQATAQFLKGISIQNLINMIIERNISELVFLLYFLVLIGALLFIDRVLMKKLLLQKLNPEQQSVISVAFRSFREGSFTLPVVIMIGSPMLLQVILPLVVVFIALIELLLPFIILGELYNVSERSLIMSIKNRGFYTGTYDNASVGNKSSPTLLGYFLMIVTILVFPLMVFLVIESGLDRFLHLIYFLISFISTQIEFVFSFFHEVIYFFVTFFVLTLVSKLYLFLKGFTKIQIIRLVENYVLKYQ